jgi:hypothetical protein
MKVPKQKQLRNLNLKKLGVKLLIHFCLLDH